MISKKIRGIKLKITLINYTQNAREILILSKNTRHLSNPRRFEEILDMTERQKAEELEYIFSTISSSWEFVNYTFLFQDVTRAFTHQLVRHRVGFSFAQQSMRVFPATGFSFYTPDNIMNDHYQNALFTNCMGSTQEFYNLLLDKGASIQDARGVLPTNICTNILVGCNLRSLSNLMETRLCVRAQGEFQQAALQMRSLVEQVHPWASQVLLPSCVMKGVCLFPRFAGCPLKNKYDHLKQVDLDLTGRVYNDWCTLMDKGYSPQPEQQK